LGRNEQFGSSASTLSWICGLELFKLCVCQLREEQRTEHDSEVKDGGTRSQSLDDLEESAGAGQGQQRLTEEATGVAVLGSHNGTNILCAFLPLIT